MFYIISHILLPLDENGLFGSVFVQILLLHHIMCLFLPPIALATCFSSSMGRTTVTLPSKCLLFMISCQFHLIKVIKNVMVFLFFVVRNVQPVSSCQYLNSRFKNSFFRFPLSPGTEQPRIRSSDHPGGHPR
jgi:hypothetical protein